MYILRFKLVVVCRSFVEGSVSYGKLIYIVLGDPSFWLENKRLVIEQRASKKKCFPKFHISLTKHWAVSDCDLHGVFSHPEPWKHDVMQVYAIPPVLEHQQQGHLTHDVMSHLLIALMQRKSMQIDDLHCLTCFHLKKTPTVLPPVAKHQPQRFGKSNSGRKTLMSRCKLLISTFAAIDRGSSSLRPTVLAGWQVVFETFWLLKIYGLRIDQKNTESWWLKSKPQTFNFYASMIFPATSVNS